jgi:hypothetical protein
MVRRCGLDSVDSGQGSEAGSCEHGNEPSGSINGDNFLASRSTVSLTRGGCALGISWLLLLLLLICLILVRTKIMSYIDKNFYIYSVNSLS